MGTLVMVLRVVLIVLVVDGTRAVVFPPMFNTCICNNIIMVVRLNTGLPSPPPSPPHSMGEWRPVGVDQLQQQHSNSTNPALLELTSHSSGRPRPRVTWTHIVIRDHGLTISMQV